MVCAMEEEDEALCIIRDFSGTSVHLKVSLNVPCTMTVREFVRNVASKFEFEPDSFQLISPHKSNPAALVENNDRFLKDVGVSFQFGSRNLFIVEGLNGASPKIVKDDLELGASASPDGPPQGADSPPPPPPLNIPALTFPDSNYINTWNASSSYITPEVSNRILGFRGLVNQAMTCYLNSLVQALYMTPEFRNSLYSWEFGYCKDLSKCIPYQLQKLFLNLQMSDQLSVHTTELTRSFGWDSSESWQQHDIQELCRVMFEALEDEFKNTPYADFINKLYGGKMRDYVKCLECGTEKVRDEMFLDIPLAIRPCRTAAAYGSLEEALRGFVQPETLEGSNQYFCEKCNAKCDAHKGLKFLNFPYMLTFHLLRFDYEYPSMHRVKLNDRVSFPLELNLNSFIYTPASDTLDKEDGSEGFPEEIACSSSKCDDSSTTDSGSAIDDESCLASSTDLNNGDYEQEIDEGIDIQDVEKSRKNSRTDKGPYMYELFAIMVHSGGAAGGHYYVLIKDFRSGEWYSFNDQNVTRVTHDDILKVYGGTSSRNGYYGSVFSGGNNAYMLMYRRIDKEKNELPMTEQEFPNHIKEMLKHLDDKSEYDVRLQEKSRESIKVRVYCDYPGRDSSISTKVCCNSDTPIQVVTQQAYNKLQLSGLVPLEQCRLVLYDDICKTIEGSLEGKEDGTIGSIMTLNSIVTKKLSMFMDIKNEDTKFSEYKPGSILVRVYNIELDTEVVNNSVTLHSNLNETVKDLKSSLFAKFGKNSSDYFLHLLLITLADTCRFLDHENHTLQDVGLYLNTKLYICFDKDEKCKTRTRAKIRNIADRYEHTVRLNVILPELEAQKRLLIDSPPKYPPVKTQKISNDITSSLDNKDTTSNELTNGGNNNLLPILLSPAAPPLNFEESSSIIETANNQLLSSSGFLSHHSDQSTSEDSSLTDSDRTIIGGPQDDYQMSSPGSSPHGSECRSSPTENLFKECEFGEEDNDKNRNKKNYYFREISNKDERIEIEIDRRTLVDSFKKMLEPYAGVASEDFKLYDSSQVQFEDKKEASYEINDISKLRDEETVYLRFGRSRDLHGKVYLLDLTDKNMEKFLFNWVIDQYDTISDTKYSLLLEIFENFQTKLDFNKCRLRRKTHQSPGQIYVDELRWKDVNLCNNWELYVQKLPEDDLFENPKKQICLLIKKFDITNGETGPFQEIVASRSSLMEIRSTIAEISNIPEDRICIGTEAADPSDTNWGKAISVNWKNFNLITQTTDWSYTINEDGCLLYYRDNKDDNNIILAPKSSPRRERSLRIYTDK